MNMREYLLSRVTNNSGYLATFNSICALNDAQITYFYYSILSNDIHDSIKYLLAYRK